MTKFLNPALAASKASRKKRQQAEETPDTAATARAMATLRRSLNKQVKKADNEERLRDKAIGDTMPDFIAAMDEEVLAPFFFSLERLATAPNRRRIASHPLRPEIVDEMHAEADEEEAAEAEEAAKANAATRKAETAKASAQEASPEA
ncbi:hypothetical protein BV394_07880 [Brevirhabdus pacifica]|uniref:Uncharacterized protein n=1 Tax=Brevirhabdus pacifica TaxID=1267768 RepID=A0A1U7DI33_9RHOB|nr:hypothetical protein [Brevirhabdus pacifica]APX89642.1 hypothetical protein BV394_07880 [Brevirhabdus pacifica]OWU74247.1 hypothetical protein ATO5_14415 [Loktanella sp. 22II-4b]PJJ85681.1 hypothetical protein CLV77_0207 [Brevirhabdus pacifica]